MIHAYWSPCKSMGIAMIIDNFDLFSITIHQIHCKLGGDMPWVGLYQICSNGYGPLIFEFFINFFIAHFGGKSLKNLLRNHGANCFKIAKWHFWRPSDLNLFNRWRFNFSSILLWIFVFSLFWTSPKVYVRLCWNLVELLCKKWCCLEFPIFHEFFNLDTCLLF